MRTPRFFLICALAALVGLPGLAFGGWVVDHGRLHVSAHRQFTCFDCHEDITEVPGHPDQANINRWRDPVFKSYKCQMCHDSPEVFAKAGSHGGKAVSHEDQLSDCVGCHDPHYLPPKGGWPEGFDPAKPVDQQCGFCHEPKTSLPGMTAEDAKCVSCHLADPMHLTKSAKAIDQNMCLHCHAKARGGMAAVDPAAFEDGPHADLNCLSCHKNAAQSPHTSQKAVGCLACHQRHPASTARDAHMGVECQACHMQGGELMRKPFGGMVGLKVPADAKDFHKLQDQTDLASCARCHNADNQVGASSKVLPAKGLLCIPCHASTGSVSDFVTAPALVLFLVGLLLVASVWFSAPRKLKTLHHNGPVAHGPNVADVIKAVILDGLLQRRLYKASPGRWAIHGLIFFPFVVRCIWGLIAWIGTVWVPDWAAGWLMIDSDAPLTAFVFDLTGLMVILGVILAICRRIGGSKRPAGLPGPDYPAVILLGLAIISGFVLESMRLALPGAPQAIGAFVGTMLSPLLEGIPNLATIYSRTWYIHAAIWGLFVIYLPFSRMKHMILTPIALALNAGEHGHANKA